MEVGGFPLHLQPTGRPGWPHHYLIIPRNSSVSFRMIHSTTGKLQFASPSYRAPHTGDQVPFTPRGRRSRRITTNSPSLVQGAIRSTTSGRVGILDEEAQRLYQLIETHVTLL